VSASARTVSRNVGLFVVLILFTGCNDGVTNPESPKAASADALENRGLVQTPPPSAAAARLAGLDIETRFRTIGVPFPDITEVGTCFTQVT
jgi:hypothetical protein